MVDALILTKKYLLNKFLPSTCSCYLIFFLKFEFFSQVNCNILCEFVYKFQKREGNPCLPDSANKNIDCLVKFEFQRNNKCFWYIYVLCNIWDI